MNHKYDSGAQSGMEEVLEVLICTIGAEGIQRTGLSSHPEVTGVRYLISWQIPDHESPELIPDSLKRKDITIITDRSRGLCKNRNHALDNSTAPLVLIGDDDVDYSAEGLRELIDCARKDKETDIFLCRYLNQDRYIKPYPDVPVAYSKAPRGYYATSFEIAFRRKKIIETGIRFNEQLGLGNPTFKCGEEDVFLYDTMKKGAKIMLYPITIGHHNHPTTGEKDGAKEYFIMTHGAVIKHIRPFTWPFRLTIHALRFQKSGKGSAWHYFRNCLRGIRYAIEQNVFGKK